MSDGYLTRRRAMDLSTLEFSEWGAWHYNPLHPDEIADLKADVARMVDQLREEYGLTKDES